MISQIYVTGNLGAKPRIVQGPKKNFLAFSIAVKGQEDMWIDCTWSFNGNQPPSVLEWLDTGKSVLVVGRPYASLLPATDEYPAKPKLCVGVSYLELQGNKEREIHGSQEQPAATDATESGDDVRDDLSF